VGGVRQQGKSPPTEKKKTDQERKRMLGCSRTDKSLGEAETELLSDNALLALCEGEALLSVVLVLCASLCLLLVESRVLADLLVSVLVDLLEVVGLDSLLLVARELLVVLLRILLEKGLHVLSDMSAKDVLAEDLLVDRLLLSVIADKATLAVGDDDTSVKSALHGTKDTSASACADKTDIEKSAERTALVELLEAVEGSTGGLLDTRIELVDVDLLGSTAGDKKTSGIGSSIVGKAELDAIAGELVGVGSDKDVVTVDAGVDDLADDVAVGETDDKTVLGRVVLVLVLGDELAALTVVSLALTTTTEGGLETLEVSLVLLDLLERHVGLVCV